jgi:hypothetical protein
MSETDGLPPTPVEVKVEVAALAPLTPIAVERATSGAVNIVEPSPTLKPLTPDGKAAFVPITERAQNFPCRTYMPGEFEPSEHYYPRCLNAQIHATVHNFLSLSNEQICTRYCHTRPDYCKT